MGKLKVGKEREILIAQQKNLRRKLKLGWGKINEGGKYLQPKLEHRKIERKIHS